MFKSKHSGWTWELKRTPFGGGGGFISDIGNTLASIDPGPALSDVGNAIDQNITQPIGSGLASADKFMTNLTPYGWALPAALVAAYFTGGGSLAAEGAAEAGAATAGEAAATSAATEAGSAAYSSAITSGATEAEATAAANAAADSALASSTGAQAGTGLEALGSTATPGADATLAAPDVAVNLGGSTSGTFGSLSPALPSAGSVGGAGAGMSAELAPGTVMGTGAAGGGAIGSTYAAGANGLPATDFFGNYIPASSINFGGVPDTIAGTTATTTNSNLAKLLKQGAASGLSNSLGKLAAGANPQSTAITGWIHGNQHPFIQTQDLPIQNAPKLDVASLAKLLQQG